MRNLFAVFNPGKQHFKWVYEKKSIKIICLIICLLALGIMVGCGDEDLFGNSGDIRCEIAVDDEDGFCGRSTNPGRCCYRDPCAFLSMFTCSFCDDELSPCCGEGEKLCSIVDICIDSTDQCPETDQPSVSEFLTFNVREVDCLYVDQSMWGAVFGPVGSELTVSSPDITDTQMEFGVTLRCGSWTKIDGRCIRMEGDPVAAGWSVFISIFSYDDKPTPEVDFIISTQDDSRTVTHVSCPGF